MGVFSAQNKDTLNCQPIGKCFAFLKLRGGDWPFSDIRLLRILFLVFGGDILENPKSWGEAGLFSFLALKNRGLIGKRLVEILR